MSDFKNKIFMNEFEKLLLAKCPQYMILLFAKNYEAVTSQEFKVYVTEHFNVLKDKEELLKLSVRDFLELYAQDENKKMKTRLENAFYAQEIETVGDLISLGKRDIPRFRNMGKRSLEAIIRICENAGLELK